MEIKQQEYSITFIRNIIIIFLLGSFSFKATTATSDGITSYIVDNKEYINTAEENTIIAKAKFNIIQYIESLDLINSEEYIQSVKDIKVINPSAEEFDFNGSVGSFVRNKDGKHVILFKRDAEDTEGLLNTIQHELVHMLESLGFFDDVDDNMISELFNFEEIEKYSKGKETLEIIFGTDAKIDDEVIDMFYQNSLFNEKEYYTSYSETIARLVNLKLYLYDKNIINNLKDDLSLEDIIYAFLDSLIENQCMCHDFQYTMILLDLSDDNTIKSINSIITKKVTK